MALIVFTLPSSPFCNVFALKAKNTTFWRCYSKSLALTVSLTPPAIVNVIHVSTSAVLSG